MSPLQELGLIVMGMILFAVMIICGILMVMAAISGWWAVCAASGIAVAAAGMAYNEVVDRISR